MKHAHLAIHLDETVINHWVAGNDEEDAIKGAEREARQFLINGYLSRKDGASTFYPASKITRIVVNHETTDERPRRVVPEPIVRKNVEDAVRTVAEHVSEPPRTAYAANPPPKSEPPSRRWWWS